MIVTLWEEKANGFQNDLAAADDGAAFVIITGLLVKKYSGQIGLYSALSAYM